MPKVEATKDPVIKAIPEPTLRRLPLYYQYLKKMQDEKKSDYISCTQIGNDLNILPIQVRKDLGSPMRWGSRSSDTVSTN